MNGQCATTVGYQGYTLKVTIVQRITSSVIGVRSLTILLEYVGRPDIEI